MATIIELYDTICKTNDNIITSGQPIQSIVFFIKDSEVNAHALQITKKDKVEIQSTIKMAAVKKGVEGYVIVGNVHDILLDKKTGRKVKEYDCILRTLYTPTQKVTERVFVEGPKILGKERLEGREYSQDFWDVWNTTEITIEKRFTGFRKNGG